MNRTFHQKQSPQAFATITILAACALWCFLVRTGPTPAIGMVCMIVGAAAVDRTVNTTYTFRPDGTLAIERGRMSRRLVINVNEIISVRKMRGSLFVAPHIVIEYGRAQQFTHAQPNDADAFIDEIKRRQNDTYNKQQ